MPKVYQGFSFSVQRRKAPLINRKTADESGAELNDSPLEDVEVLGDLNEKPSESKVLKSRRVPPTHDQQTRKLIAILILSVLSLLYLGLVAFFVLTDLKESRFTAAIAGISGMQALGAAAVGFYYGSQKG